MQILVQRRGSMYDPLVVDTFVAVKDKLAESLLSSESQPEVVVRSERWRTQIAESSDIVDVLTMNAPVQHLARVIAQSIISATPARIVIIFVRDARRDELHSLLVMSADGPVRLDISMPVGARVTGWVAANGTSIVNADAALDLPDEAKEFGLKRCLSMPITHNLEQLGVVSLYMDDPRGFSERDSVLVEAAVKAVDLSILAELVSTLGQKSQQLKKQPPTVH